MSCLASNNPSCFSELSTLKKEVGREMHFVLFFILLCKPILQTVHSKLLWHSEQVESQLGMQRASCGETVLGL